MTRKLIALLLLAGSASLAWYVFNYRGTPVAPPAVTRMADPYAPRDWQQPRESALNISLYTFWDRNRNGVYDVGDKPMASVAVELSGPGGEVRRADSNSNGYANFKMALGSVSHPVKEAGIYQFRVLKPGGWQITTGNPVQEISFHTLAGSVAGLVAKRPPHWVGLAPDLTLRFLTNQAGMGTPPNQLLQLVSPEGRHQEAVLSDWKRGQQTVYPGAWQVLAGAAQRILEVKDVPVALLIPSPQTADRAPLPYTVTEDFDWLQRAVIEKIPNGHLSLDWDYLLALHNQEYHSPGYANGLTSGHAVAYNSSGHPVTISAPEGELFDFVGGYFSSAWPAAEGETLNISAWRDKQLIASSSLTLSYLGPTWLEADLRGVDRLVLSTSHYWQFAADDLTFRLAQPPVD